MEMNKEMFETHVVEPDRHQPLRFYMLSALHVIVCIPYALCPIKILLFGHGMGDYVKPTFHPSLISYVKHWEKDEYLQFCHSWIRDENGSFLMIAHIIWQEKP